MLRVLLLLVAAALMVASIDGAAAERVALTPPFQQVVLAHREIAPGAEQEIAVTLEAQAATPALFQLMITYADGTTQDVLDQSLGSTAGIAWQIPAGVPEGTATFRLKTSGCGCGDPSSSSGSTALEAAIEGTFYVRP
jgi:hypothetical protein